MKPSRRTAIPWLASSTLVLLALPAAGHAEIRKTWHHNAPVGPNVRISISHGDGDVFFHATPGAQEIRAEIVYEAAAPNLDQDLEVLFHFDPTTFNLYAWEDGEPPKSRSAEDIYRIDVWAPPTIAIQTSGDDGDIVLPAWQADVEARLDDGQFIADEIVGDFELLSDDGNATIGRLVGDVKVRTRDGTLRIDRAESSKIEVQSADGDVAIGLADPPRGSGSHEQRVDLSSDDGHIGVTLLTREPIRLEASTYEGSIDLDVEQTDGLRHVRRRVDGRLGRGNPTRSLRIVTRDADVMITDRQP